MFKFSNSLLKCLIKYVTQWCAFLRILKGKKAHFPEITSTWSILQINLKDHIKSWNEPACLGESWHVKIMVCSRGFWSDFASKPETKKYMFLRWQSHNHHLFAHRFTSMFTAIQFCVKRYFWSFIYVSERQQEEFDGRTK